MKKNYIFRLDDDEQALLEELKQIYNIKTSNKFFIHMLNLEAKRQGLLK